MYRIFIFFIVAMFAAVPAGAERIQSPTQSLSVPVSQGVVVSLKRPMHTVFVAQPEIASYQVINSRKLLVFGMLPGQTSIYAMDVNGSTCYSATINVAYDTGQMQEALRRDFPSLSLKLTPAANGVAVSGKVPSAQVQAEVLAVLDSFVQLGSPAAAAMAGASGATSGGGRTAAGGKGSGAGTGKGALASRHGKIINRLTVTMPTQVTIRVRVAEVSRKLSEKLGFKWGYMATNIFDKSIKLGLASNTLTGLPGEVISPLIGGPADVAGLIDALAGESLVSVLAEPNLSVLSGETASFLAGGQMPLPTNNEDGEVTIEFKDFGVLLSVTPTILSPNRISLRLRPEVSEPSLSNGIAINGVIIPGFVVRRAETTVELASGQSFAIGGLLQNNLSNIVNKIPGLGDIPILGALARSTELQRGETELVIIATAYVSDPSGGNLRIPNAELYVPSIFERMFVGKKPTAKSGPIQANDFMYY